MRIGAAPLLNPATHTRTPAPLNQEFISSIRSKEHQVSVSQKKAGNAPTRDQAKRGACVAGLGAVRPRGWPSGLWTGGARGMGYRGGAGPGQAPPPSLSGAVYSGDLVRGLGDHVGLTGDAELAESGQDPGLDERAEQLFAVPHVGHAQNAVAEGGDVKAHPGGHVAVPADSLAERVVLLGRDAVPLLHDDGGHDFLLVVMWRWCAVKRDYRGSGLLSTPLPGRRPASVRMKSVASISTCSPSRPWRKMPPAGPSSTRSSDSRWSSAHSATMSATSRPSWSGLRSIGLPVAWQMSMRWHHTSRVNPTSSRYFSGRQPMGGPNGSGANRIGAGVPQRPLTAFGPTVFSCPASSALDRCSRSRTCSSFRPSTQ